MTTFANLLEMDYPTLAVAFFNSKLVDTRTLEIVSKYGQSKFSRAPLDVSATAQNLSEHYRLSFRPASTSTIVASISNPQELALVTIREKLFEAILEKIGANSRAPQVQKEIALALVGLRGSYDGKSRYAVDAQSGHTSHNVNILSLLRTTGLAPYVNYNPRPSGSLKDDQVRLDIHWVLQNLAEEIESLNTYKASILRNIK